MFPRGGALERQVLEHIYVILVTKMWINSPLYFQSKKCNCFFYPSKKSVPIFKKKDQEEADFFGNEDVVICNSKCCQSGSREILNSLEMVFEKWKHRSAEKVEALFEFLAS